MKKVNNIIRIITSIVSILSLIFITKTDAYGVMIKSTIVLILFVPTILKKIFKIKISDGLELVFLIYIFFAQYLGTIIDLYHKIYFYDTLMHFLSGFLTSVLAINILVNLNVYDKKKILFNILFVVAFSSLVAFSWECIEFVGDKLFHHDAQNVLTTGVDDTMKDMIVAILASILFCLLYAYEEVNNKKLIVKKYIEGIR